MREVHSATRGMHVPDQPRMSEDGSPCGCAGSGDHSPVTACSFEHSNLSNGHSDMNAPSSLVRGPAPQTPVLVCSQLPGSRVALAEVPTSLVRPAQSSAVPLQSIAAPRPPFTLTKCVEAKSARFTRDTFPTPERERASIAQGNDRCGRCGKGGDQDIHSAHQTPKAPSSGALSVGSSRSHDCYCFGCKGNLCPWYKWPCGQPCYPSNWISGKCPSGWKLCPGTDGNWKCCSS